MTETQHSVIYSCNDSVGNMGFSSTRYFTVNLTIPPSFICELTVGFNNINIPRVIIGELTKC